MTYDPTRVPIRELILRNIETALIGISTPSYANTMRAVRRWNGNVILDLPTSPCAVIVPLSETLDDGVSNIISNVMDVGIVIGTRGTDWPLKINTLMDDARVALLADPSRGTVAVTTRIKSVNVYDADPKQTVGAMQMVLEVQYRTLYEDPTRAI